MAKKKEVRIHCEICNKITAHEIRTLDGQEGFVCLQCEGTQRAAENAARRYENQYQTNKFVTEQTIEAERLRTLTPGG